MARIRTIKPEFFTSEDIVSLSPLARLLYVALWCEADKEGRLVWKPRTFKMRYMPGDNCDIDGLCNEIVQCGLVKLYGDGLAFIPQFSKHQHVNPRESASTLPAPEGVQPIGPKKVGKTTREAVFERDGHACVRCGATDRLEVDHILPQSLGGPHILENLRTLCKSCNASRPVAGKALAEDLASDGFTVASLRAKFGIDASIQDQHTQVGREGREGKEGNTRDADAARDEAPSPSAPEGFETFWAEWPSGGRKGGKPECLKVWRKERLEAQASTIVAHVKALKGSREWTKDGGEFIPAPVVYLRGKRWDGAEVEASGMAPERAAMFRGAI